MVEIEKNSRTFVIVEGIVGYGRLVGGRHGDETCCSTVPLTPSL